MTEAKQENQLGSTSVDNSNTFKIELDPHNSAFGISADTLRLLAASYNVTPEALITRAVTMWAQAVIPDLDLDSPSLTPEQIELLHQRQQAADATTTQPQQTLANAFKKLLEGTGDQHENDESSPRDGGHS
jgi:hypothetical protein